MKNKNMKEIILYSPYIVFIFMCIYHAIFGYEDTLRNVILYGFEAITLVFADALSFIIRVFCGPGGPLLIAWVGYQIYYFISFKNYEKETMVDAKEFNKEINKSTSKNMDLKKILFVISILQLFSFIFPFILILIFTFSFFILVSAFDLVISIVIYFSFSHS